MYLIYSKFSPYLQFFELSSHISFIFLLRLFLVFCVTIPKNVQEALDHPGWRQAMIVEMQALENSGTWELVPLSPGKKTIGCKWVYAVKVEPNGEVDRLKAWLVAKGYTQIYDLDYCDTFSLVARIKIVWLFLAMAAILHWPLYQLDIKMSFFMVI